jgi:hypothetical protein
MFHILTILSVPAVARHPRMCGLTSKAHAAPSWAAIVKRAGDGWYISEGIVRASKLTTIPFSKETCSDEVSLI